MGVAMEGELHQQKDDVSYRCSILLELAASDDLTTFKSEVERRGLDVDEASFWYCRSIGLKRMGFEERTPLMIASMYGSTDVARYIVGSGKADVNRACGASRVTTLHCAVAGGSNSTVEIVKLLVDAGADGYCVDANGNRPIDLVAPALRMLSGSKRRVMELLLKGNDLALTLEEEPEKTVSPPLLKEGTEKKEYPIDVTLPDINNGIYGTDEFRMYTFKVKPCSRAYTHDWTECPFVHPGENARRRDPRKYPYSCVPCPEFRKGACPKGDGCEYAHGVFESWLHPAQYRTRLCKEETTCARKVCFFAHKPEELRPVYASTGSAMPSPRSSAVSAVDMATMSPLTLGSSSLPLPTTATPPTSPMMAASSPKSGGLWQNKVNITPPALQLPSSRLKTAFSARDFDLEMELLGLENCANQLQQQQQQQQLMDEISNLSPSWSRLVNLKPTNLDNAFGSPDPSLLSPLKGLSVKSAAPSGMQSPTGLQMRQNVNQLRTSYPADLPSSPARNQSSYGFNSSAAVAQAVMNARYSAFSKRSQSFIDHRAVTGRAGLSPTANSTSLMSPSSNLSDWSSPNGKLDWGVQGDELHKLRKSASFGFRNRSPPKADEILSNLNEPDVSWVHSLVKDVPSSAGPALPPWAEQMYIEPERMLA